MAKIEVQSPNVRYDDDMIESDYDYQTTDVSLENGVYKVHPRNTRVTFRTQKKVPRLGVMLVGWGGNNGTTVTAAVLANRHNMTWKTKEGVNRANYFGSVTQASTVYLGDSVYGDIYIPLKELVPTVDPNNIVFDGWDISSMNLADAMERAEVLDVALQEQLKPFMEHLIPRPAIYDKDFIAANQKDRVDNVIKGTKKSQVEQIRSDIRDFKTKQNLDKVIVIWTANTERYADTVPGVNDIAVNLQKSIDTGAPEISPSTLYAVASVLEECAYINGSPQNTFVPGLLELAEQRQVFVGGNDFKSGQTKIKSVLVDFLVDAGIKPVSIVSYNHLGNNDGKNLSAPEQVRSKEISKSNVVDDIVECNGVLYKPGEKPDHCVVTKYVPYVGDSKRALDEYTSEIMLGGHNTIVVHNTCEDSLLASPLILDLIVFTELCQRITFSIQGAPFQTFHSVLSILSYLFKAPLVPEGALVVNSLFKQRCCIENFLRALLGLAPLNHLGLECKLNDPVAWKNAKATTKMSNRFMWKQETAMEVDATFACGYSENLMDEVSERVTKQSNANVEVSNIKNIFKFSAQFIASCKVRPEIGA